MTQQGENKNFVSEVIFNSPVIYNLISFFYTYRIFYIIEDFFTQRVKYIIISGVIKIPIYVDIYIH